jgi:flagellar biosynthetic protein FliR
MGAALYQLLSEWVPALPVFVLVLFRLSGLWLSAPIFANSMIPIRVRAGFVLVVGLLIFPQVRLQAPAELDLAAALVGGVGEIMIGMTIGLGIAMLVTGIETAGLVMGQQSALTLGEVINPTLEEQSSLIAQIYGMSFLTLFLLVGGHRATLAALIDTFDAIPLLTFGHSESVLTLVLDTLAASFLLGIRLAGPVLLTLFLIETALAILSRTIPQLNVLTVGFTLRVWIVHALLAVIWCSCLDPMLDGLWDTLNRLREGLGLG